MRSWRPIVKMPGTSLSASKRVVGPRQAGLLAPDHCRWAPSQGTASVDLAHGSSVTVTGSRRIRTGFPFQLSSSHLSVVLNLWNAWPASPPPKGDRIIGCAAKPEMKTPPEPIGRRRSVNEWCVISGDARLLEVGFQLLDGWDAVDLVGLDIHELLLGREDELDQVRDFDVRRVGNTKYEQLLDDLAGHLGALRQVHLFERPQDAVQRIKAQLALGVLGPGRDYSQRRALRLSLDRFVDSQAGFLRRLLVWPAPTVRAGLGSSK